MGILLQVLILGASFVFLFFLSNLNATSGK
jgi:hypothetical protein